MLFRSDINGARPCLTIDQINQYKVQIQNEIAQARPSIKVRPVDDLADVRTAEALQGYIRHIEDRSRAKVAYGNAADGAITAGQGYFRVLTEYEAADSMQQEIRIAPIMDPFSCFLGPHEMPDGSDAKEAWIFTQMRESDFRREYPKAK